MLKTLRIKNVALIRSAEIEFDSGLNVLSGETGAGKSVAMESLNFALGQKADKSMICHGETECSVSCSFDISSCEEAKNALFEIGVEPEDEIVIKRTMNVDGRGSIKLNGETVTASMLRKVTSALVDVHGQSDHFLLMKETNQLALLDDIGGVKVVTLKSRIYDEIQKIKEIDESLAKLGGDEESRARRLDYLAYSVKEIENASLKDGEEEELSVRKKKLMNAEKIALACSGAVSALSDENSAIDLIGSACRLINSISAYAPEYEELSVRLSSALDEVSDISELISDSVEEDFDPRELDEIEKRVEEIDALKRKYGKSFAEIMQTLDNFKKEFDLLSSSAETSEKLLSQRKKLVDKLNGIYAELTVARKKVADVLRKDLSAKLKELAMKGAEFSVEFTESDVELSSCGKDKVCFMFTANKGEQLKPLNKVISGGELSRLMLAIKAVTGGAYGTETFVFDEIDVGISGDAASVVAENFAKISKDKQLIAISHLPQIVAMSDTSFLIAKGEESERTVTHVTKLDSVGKTDEVVRLVGGSKDSQVARAHAVEMIDKATAFKATIN